MTYGPTRIYRFKWTVRTRGTSQVCGCIRHYVAMSLSRKISLKKKVSYMRGERNGHEEGKGVAHGHGWAMWAGIEYWRWMEEELTDICVT
jgi:hypothetical protein